MADYNFIGDDLWRGKGRHAEFFRPFPPGLNEKQKEAIVLAVEDAARNGKAEQRRIIREALGIT